MFFVFDKCDQSWRRHPRVRLSSFFVLCRGYTLGVRKAVSSFRDEDACGRRATILFT
jgi:hypothetical protein